MSSKGRRNKPARYVLPETVEPPGTKCFTIHVPNEKNYLAAFRGQMEALARAYAWGDDDAHTALEAAARWRYVLDGMGDCGVPDIQFRQPSFCELQYSVDGGTTWLHAGNFADCASSKILDAIADGTISAGAQQSPGGSVPANECHTYHVTLAANQRWICPVPVSAGYSVIVQDAKGGWSDSNTVLSSWFCPQGTLFSLGECGGTYSPTQPTDPNQNAAHMRLVGVYDTSWFDAYNTTTSIPEGVSSTNLYLQANDGSLSDNAGSITFTVIVCNVRWCYQWDFTTGNDRGWIPRYYTVMNNNGWSDTDNAQYDAVYIDIGNLPAYTADTLELEFLDDWVGSSPRIYYANVQQPQQYNGYSNLNGTKKISIPISMSGEALAIAADRSVGGNQYFGTQRLQIVRLMGGGINPFGTSNCP